MAESGASPATKMIQLELTTNSKIYLLSQPTITETNLSFLCGLYLIHFPYTLNYPNSPGCFGTAVECNFGYQLVLWV